MAYRRKKGGPKGRRCVRRKRVRVRGHGMQLRCAKYGPKGSGRRTAAKRRTKRKGYHRKPAGMARKGSHCVSYRRVRVRGHGKQRRCRKYSR